jgi:hypothetical protein
LSPLLHLQLEQAEGPAKVLLEAAPSTDEQGDDGSPSRKNEEVRDVFVGKVEYIERRGEKKVIAENAQQDSQHRRTNASVPADDYNRGTEKRPYDAERCWEHVPNADRNRNANDGKGIPAHQYEGRP